MITGLCLFHLMTRRSPADHTNPREPSRIMISKIGSVPKWAFT